MITKLFKSEMIEQTQKLTQLVKDTMELCDIPFEESFPATSYFTIEHGGKKYRMMVDVQVLNVIED